MLLEDITQKHLSVPSLHAGCLLLPFCNDNYFIRASQIISRLIFSFIIFFILWYYSGSGEMTRWASVLEMSSYPQKPHKTPSEVMVM